MRIGEVAEVAGCRTQTVRYYEREGLLPEPSRNEANYRIYDTDHVERLTFIRHCRALDMSLEEVRTVLAVYDNPGAPCGDVTSLVERNLEHVESRIRELKRLRHTLMSLRERCDGDACGGNCGILSELKSPLYIANEPTLRQNGPRESSQQPNGYSADR